MNQLVLVNHRDEELGSMEKLEAHKLGLLHRAFSVFIFNSKNELLIHKRAIDKYHSGGLWTNSCCSHPFPAEDYSTAAIRRVKEELGLTINKVEKLGHIIYKVELENDLTEHEFDYILKVNSDEKPQLNYDEISEFTYQPIEEIKSEMKVNPEKFTFWFREILMNNDFF